MAKLALKAAPTFKAQVEIPVAGVKPVKMEFTFRHRTRKELDVYLADLRAKQAEGGNADEVAAVMDVAIGWENDEPFNAENVGEFLDSYHKAAWAIGNAYITELMQAREGN